VAAGSDFFSTRAFQAAALVALALSGTAAAQQSAPQQQPNSTSALNLPQTAQVFGTGMPSVVKATAIINGEVITQTDVDQRLALLVMASGGRVPADEIDRLRQQVLRNLIDETLQIQAAKAEEITVKPQELDRAVQRFAENNKQTVEQVTAALEANGSSIKSIRRQIEGEIAWGRLQRAKIESSVTVGDEEVKAILDKMNAAKGTEEYRVGEIFLSASAGNQDQAFLNANKILEQLKNGASFAGYARQYSEASTAAVGGDLGWVRPEQLPEPLAAQVRGMAAGSISNPIPVQGGFSIIAVQDTRKVLTADPRDAILSLKQVTVPFPPGTSRQQAEPIVARVAQAAQNVGGCGGAERIAAEFHGEVVQSDDAKLRDLPAFLQQIMLSMQVGQATQPFGSVEDGVRFLVLCGRDEVSPNQPSAESVSAALAEERVNIRARRYLRDLRRDAVIEFR
jgi:peptidyl-prolyl cis-trans isomerase SurA